MKQAVTVNFPAPLPAKIPCPICEGNKCHVCQMKGKIEVTVDAKVPIQRHLIVRYVAEHMNEVAFELSKHFGLVPEVETVEMFDVSNATYELTKVSSLGGVIWVANRVDELESPRYFKSYSEIKEFKKGMIG
tara:strand:- start:2802 stop:3197 length:396 start_codon:yes stop_codon:yes gene_type:complete